MLYNLYQFTHQSLGLCFWDFPALLLVAVMIVMSAVHMHNQRKRKRDFENRMEEKLKKIKKERVNKESAKA